jgi:hypothetical protein
MVNKIMMMVCMAFYGSAYSKDCDPCVCNDWANTLSCYGPEVNVFPNVTERGISHIDIINTSLTQLPDIRDFPHLFTMDIRDNKHIDCNDIIKLKEEATNVIITTDCDDNKDRWCHMSKDCIDLCIQILSNSNI